jgi:murein DD-endopeptidase MepM/ murein hydrolase activator NlpD
VRRSFLAAFALLGTLSCGAPEGLGGVYAHYAPDEAIAEDDELSVLLAVADAPRAAIVVERHEVVPDPPPVGAPVARTLSDEERSPPLRNSHFRDPMPGGYLGGWYGDTGLDIAGNHLPVYAIAAGTLEYSERGHTLWMTPPDTPGSVRIALDEPIPWKGHHRVTHVYYTHMSQLVFDQPEALRPRRHVEAGERIGTSGVGNHVPHLHLGVLLDGLVEQDSWDGILTEGDVRALLGGYKNGELWPAFHPRKP